MVKYNFYRQTSKFLKMRILTISEGIMSANTNACLLLIDMQIGSYSEKYFGAMSQWPVEMCVPLDPLIPLLGICPNEIITKLDKDYSQDSLPLY